jgi:hypothetical protein
MHYSFLYDSVIINNKKNQPMLRGSKHLSFCGGNPYYEQIFHCKVHRLLFCQVISPSLIVMYEFAVHDLRTFCGLIKINPMIFMTCYFNMFFSSAVSSQPTMTAAHL